MSFKTLYRPLCDIVLYHGYFLNEGEDAFNSMNDDEKEIFLRNYDFGSFLEVIPSPKTKEIIKNFKLILSYRPDRIKVITRVEESNNNKPFIPLTLNTSLTFLVKIKDFLFENYSDVTLDSTQLYLFTNKRPSTENISFPLIPKLSDTILIDDTFRATENTTEILKETLSLQEKSRLIGVIQLTMQADDASLHILDNSSELTGTLPEFKIHFNNRRTFWKYLREVNGFEVETNADKPLTKLGFIEIDPLVDFDSPPPEASDYQYPNPTPSIIKKEPSKTYSEIFI